MMYACLIAFVQCSSPSLDIFWEQHIISDDSDRCSLSVNDNAIENVNEDIVTPSPPPLPIKTASSMYVIECLCYPYSSPMSYFLLCPAKYQVVLN